MSDTEFYREIEEEVRREKLKKFWDQYGYFIIGGAVAIVAAVAGLKGYEAWQKNRAESAGAEFVRAEALASGGKEADARSAFEKIVSGGTGGYPALAKLRLAGASASSGKIEEAVAAYDRVSKDGSVDELFRGFAKVQAALLRIDDADFSEIKTRLDGLLNAEGTWRNSARELLGLSAYKNKKHEEANDYFTQILSDQGAPQKLRQRAELMLSLIAGESQGKSAAGDKAGDAASDKK